MKFDDRTKFVYEFLDANCMAVMKSKGAEYSRGEEDSNSNFKRVAEAIGSDPVTVAWVYALKHIDSISSWVKSRETPSGEPIEGRIGDAINYLLILASLHHEGRRNDSQAATEHATQAAG